MEPIIPKKYKEFQEKFQLPKFVDLKETFRFDVEEEGSELIFDQIRAEISERLFTFSEKMLEPILSGSDDFCCMFEHNMLTKNDISELFSLYKKLQVFKWENNILSLRYDEKKTIKWIKRMWDFWNDELQIKLMYICEKFSIGWRDLKLKSENPHYFV